MSESVRVVLVGCSAAKLEKPAPARDLYTSPLFRKARAYALASGLPLKGMSVGRRLAWLSAFLQTLSLAEPSATEGAAVCDFCGKIAPCAVSELGAQRFPGDDTPARICRGCAEWALASLKASAW